MSNEYEHFNGKRYINPHANTRGLRQALHWLWNRQIEPWPQRIINPQQIKHTRIQDELWLTFINHSTTLIQVENKNILTDPIWSERASPFSKIGPKRIYQPGVRFDDLPPIDIVLISHNHYDHLDCATLKKLEMIHQPTYYTLKGNRPLLRKMGLKQVQELDWWDSINLINGQSIISVPAQHFSGRGLFDRNKTLWGGFVFKGRKWVVYFAGDTGYGPHFKEIYHRIGMLDLALLPIGAFKPEWFMKPVHMSPVEAVQAHLDLKAHQSVAIHFGTFQLGDEKVDEAQIELQQALRSHQLNLNQFWILEPGEGRQVTK